MKEDQHPSPASVDGEPSQEEFVAYEKEVAADEGMVEPAVAMEQQVQEATTLDEQTGQASDELEHLKRERDEYLDQWRRSTAEFQNFKKREERLRVERERAANARLLKKLLPVLDDLQRGSQHVPEDLSSNDWVNGMLAIERKLWAVMEQESVTAIEAKADDDFDPLIHEALLTQPSDGFESNQILQTLEAGYKQGDQVLRPARVIVAE